MSKSIRALCYCRISDPTEEDGESLKRQEEVCRAYCAEHGYTVVGVFKDAKSGAAYRDREGLQSLLQTVRGGSVDVVVCRDLDRLTRHQASLYLFVEECEEHDTRLELVNEAFEDTPEGRLMRSVRAYVAEIERLKITQRTHDGLRARVRSGKPLAGPRAPYGYRWRDAAKSGFVVDDAEAAVVRRLFVAIAAGESAAGLARALTVEGVPSPMGLSHWTTYTLCKMVRHPVYKGDAVSYRWKLLKKKPGKKRPGREERPADDWSVLPEGTAPPLVPAELWGRAVCALEGSALPRSRPGVKSDRYLLSGGYAVCGSCGGALVGNTGRDGWRCYVCRTNKRVASEGCSEPVTISQARLDREVWGYVLARVADRKTWDRLLAEAERRVAQERESPPPQRQAARDAAETAREITNLTRELARTDDEDTAAVIRASLRAAVARKRHQDAAAQASPRRLRAAERLARLRRAAAHREALTRLAAIPHAAKRAALAEFEVRVTVHRGDVRTGERWRITSLLES